MAVFEAMSCGFPVVAAYVLGVREVLATGKCGLLVPPNLPAEMARAIERILDNPEFARHFATGGSVYLGDDYSLRIQRRRRYGFICF